MRVRRFVSLLALALLVLAGLFAPAVAQEAQRALLEQLKTQLDRIEQTMNRPGIDQGGLQELRNEIDPLIERIREATGEVEPVVRELDERVKQLGPRPAQGQTEDANAARQREELTRQFNAADADLRNARVLGVRANQLSERLADKRRELLSRALFERSASILDPTLWRDVGQAIPRIATGFGFFIQDWFTVLGNAGNALGFVVLALTIALAVLVYGPLRRRLLAAPHGELFAWGSAEAPTSAQRSIVAAWTALVNALLPVAAAFLVVRVLSSLELIPFRFGLVVDAAVFAIVIYTGLRAIASALLAPDRPAWRFVPLSDALARRAYKNAGLIAGVVAIFYVLQAVNAAIIAPLSASVALLGLRCLVFAGVLALGLAASARIEAGEREARAKDPYAGPAPRLGGWHWVRLTLWIAAAVIGGSALLGYQAFGTFLSGQVVWALIVIGALSLLVHLVDDVATELTRSGGAASRRVATTLGIEASTVEQVGIVLSGVLRVLLITVGIFMLIAPWGVESRDALSWIRALFFGVQIGGITISISAILVAVTIFFAGLVATRSIQGWLDHRLLPTTRMDVGLRNSIRTVFGYIGVLIAAMVGFSFLGIDLQNLAIVAGALSVGIGFGLQSIVSNFVSGLILLAERPIKAGDWIVVGDAEGYVRRINVRSTEIETFDKAVLIVPNANLVSGVVRNWMHNDLFGRAKIRLRVPYGSDYEKVRDLLVEIAKGHDLVTCDPDPRAMASDFEAEGVIFELFFTVTNVDRSPSVRSDLRFEILKRFQAEGITIK